MTRSANTLFSFLSAVLLAMAAQLSAAHTAPLWIERQFIPEAELLDPIFSEHDETAQTVIDHSAWAAFLNSRLVESEDGVNRITYGAISPSERDMLAAYVQSLESVDTTLLSRHEQLAFWINLYNAATIILIADNYPIESIRKIDAPWDHPVATVNGVDVTLNDIESRIIRPVFNDPRIHYAVNCASIGCPNLAPTPYTGATLDAMLDEAARSYVNHPRGVRIEGDDLVASKIYGWYREDFGENKRDVVDHIRQYASPELNEALRDFKKINDYEYDWSLNDASPENN